MPVWTTVAPRRMRPQRHCRRLLAEAATERQQRPRRSWLRSAAAALGRRVRTCRRRPAPPPPSGGGGGRGGGGRGGGPGRRRRRRGGGLGGGGGDGGGGGGGTGGSDPGPLPDEPRFGPIPRGHPALRASDRPRRRAVEVGGARGRQSHASPRGRKREEASAGEGGAWRRPRALPPRARSRRGGGGTRRRGMGVGARERVDALRVCGSAPRPRRRAGRRPATPRS